MKIILAGIEYVGTTTFSNLLREWKKDLMGEPFYLDIAHDHFKLPHTSGHPDNTTLEEQNQILNLSPKLKEMYHRYAIYYHVMHYMHDDDLTIGLHIEEAIFARKYYGYGLDGEPFDRRGRVFKEVEARIKKMTEDPVIIVHMVANKDVIRERMLKMSDTSNHSNSPVKIDDIETLMKEYDEWIAMSSIGPVIKIDTSVDTPEQTLEKLIPKLEPHYTKRDIERIKKHKSD
jgi:broad-specificity NMP kinase